MNGLQHPDAENIIAHFRCWIERVVIGLNLCPFARQPYEGDRVRFVVSGASEPALLLADLEQELELLRATEATKTETTLLIHPDVLHDFFDYNDFLGIVEKLLEQGGYTGEFQVASFHPDYRFADTEADDAGNYTNRSPYPALHLLREASLEHALESVAAPEQIPERNIRTLEKLGAEHMRTILAECLGIPILYTFRRCPYAMRTRLAVSYSGVAVELREVDLKHVPGELTRASAKETVPVLVLPDGKVLDESWDILLWALRRNDPDCWLGEDESHLIAADQLVEMNDYSFKEDLDHYKYADQHPEHPAEEYRSRGEEFLQELEELLTTQPYLLGDRITLADIGLFPFIRQFAFVDKDWFDQAPYPHLQRWLDGFLQSDLFAGIMVRHPVWKPGDVPVIQGKQRVPPGAE